MKLGIVITMHYSKKNRPNGMELVNNCLSTLYEHLDYDFNVYIVDNQSDIKSDIGDGIDNIWYHYVENQFETGLTGAWNLGINKAVSDNCDIILNINDDLEFNTTINNFINIIENHEYKDLSFFGPVASNCPGWPEQIYDKPIDKLIELTGKHWDDILAGFMVGFTNKFFERFKNKDNNLFSLNHKYNLGDGKWGGQEGEQIVWKSNSAKLFVVGYCWVNHIKDAGWRIAREIDSNNYNSSYRGTIE